jgi:coenzyme F420-reducing hydrogenase beta subunit
MIDNVNDLAQLRGSKYLESKIGDCYRLVKEKLIKDIHVLFTGTPCQVAGLYAYLGNNYDKLLTCNLICKGIPSRKVFRAYVDYLQSTYGFALKSYSFRNKTYGWAPNEAILLKNGKHIIKAYMAEKAGYYYAFASKGLFCRLSCYHCPFKGLPSYADITLGDFWSIRSQRPDWDDNKGTSLVLVNSKKGESVFAALQAMLRIERFPLDCIMDNVNLLRSARMPKERKAFFKKLDHVPFEILMKKYMGPPGCFKTKLNTVKRMLRAFLVFLGGHNERNTCYKKGSS